MGRTTRLVALDNFSPTLLPIPWTTPPITQRKERSLATKREIWRQKLLLVHIRPGDAQGLPLLFRYIKKERRESKKRIYDGSRREGGPFNHWYRSKRFQGGRDLVSCGIKSNWQGPRYADCGLYILRHALSFCLPYLNQAGSVAEECFKRSYFISSRIWERCGGVIEKSRRVENEHL